MQLNPSDFFAIARQIDDHLDTDTKFVRAVVRNARTDKLIATVDLIDRGDNRFSKEWQVPGDSSGLGFYITITTSVYTTDAYTTKSENYGDEQREHLIAERRAPTGGHSISTGDIKELLDDVIKPPVAPIVNLGGIEKEIKRIRKTKQPRTVVKKENVIIKTEEVDLIPLIKKIDSLQEDINELKQKEIINQTVDISSVIELLKKALNKKESFSIGRFTVALQNLNKKIGSIKQIEMEENLPPSRAKKLRK